MDFSFFQTSIPKLKEIILPGIKAQLKMASSKRNILLQMKNKSHLKPNKASVLICIYQNIDGKACFALMERADDNGVHSGQICLPGGKTEKLDESSWSTAARETEEEIGINKSDLCFVKELTSIYIPPSNFIVYPYIATYIKTPLFIIDKNEVKKVFNVSLEALLSEKSIVEIDIHNHYMDEKEIPAYSFNGNIVWGATAMILSEFKFLLKRITINKL